MSAAIPTQTVSALYLEHHPWLLGWLRRKLGCPQSAADLSHDAFIRLLESPGVPTLREPRAYLMVMANRLLINRYQRQRVEHEVLRTLAVLAENKLGASAEEAASAQQMLEQVVSLLLHEVDEKPRQAFLMARLDGQSYSEIASILSVSETRVKQYLAMVLAHCHARLGQLESSP